MIVLYRDANILIKQVLFAFKIESTLTPNYKPRQLAAKLNPLIYNKTRLTDPTTFLSTYIQLASRDGPNDLNRDKPCS